MIAVLNKLTAPDNYSPLATIESHKINRVIIDVSNQGIYWQLEEELDRGNGGYWNPLENYMLPGSRVVPGPFKGFRFRAAVPLAQIPATTSQAQVTVRAE